MAHITEQKLTKEETVFITLGKKATEFFKKKGYQILHEEAGIPDTLPLEKFEAIATDVTLKFLSHDYKEVFLAYSNFLSTFSQEGALHLLLPVQQSDIEGVVRGIAPIKGKYADSFNNKDIAASLSHTPYLFEPHVLNVLDQLLQYLVTLSLYHGALEGKASEHSARMVAMKSAGDKARDIKKDLTRTFNKVRQGAITREVSEIIGGIEALKI
jgi:F-type H+-transporting ATPase subunit gamma